VVAPPTAREPVAPPKEEAVADDDNAQLTTATAKNSAASKPTKIKSAKSHHRSVRRKDPAKW
jgi:hypothetical protein